MGDREAEALLPCMWGYAEVGQRSIEALASYAAGSSTDWRRLRARAPRAIGA
jgi:thiaminase